MVLESLDNISDDVLDLIKLKFSDKGSYRVLDDRKILSFGKPREYFLFSNFRGRGNLEWCFIWIGKNLWQFTYLNTECMSKGGWVNPLDLLNELLNSD